MNVPIYMNLHPNGYIGERFELRKVDVTAKVGGGFPSVKKRNQLKR